MKKIAPALLAGLCLFPAANAAEKVSTIPVKDGATAETLNRGGALPYTYADIGFTFLSVDDDSSNLEDGALLTLAGSWLFMPNVFAVGSYGTAEYEAANGATADASTIQLGVGYRYPVSMSVDLVATLEFVQSEFEGTQDLDESGYQLTVGARGSLMDKLEGAGSVSYSDVFALDTSTTLNLTALYDLSQWVPKLQAGAEFNFGDDSLLPVEGTSYGLKARYSF